MPPATKKHHFAGHHIALLIGGDSAKTAYLKSAEGGMFKASTTEEPNAGYHIRSKHASVREIDPLSFEFGMAGSRWALDLVQKICQNPSAAHVPFEGTILYADSNFKTQYSYDFTGARLTEFTLPKLDAKSKELAYLKLKCQPETVNFQIGEGDTLHPGNVSKQKQWLTSAFRLTLGKEEIAATSIEALTVKIGAKAHQIGGIQSPRYTSTGKLEMPKLSFVVPMTRAKSVLDWFQKSIVLEKGLDEGGGYEQTAEIEYLDPTRKKALYSITLEDCGPETCSIVKGTNESSVGMKFDCYVTSMKLETAGDGII